MVITTNRATRILPAAYRDGGLILPDYSEGDLSRNCVHRGPESNVISDSRTMAAGNASGTLQLCDFETLKVSYRITSKGYGIRFLVFSSDHHCSLDIRELQCNTCKRSINVRQSQDDENDAISTTTNEISLAPIEDSIPITTLVSHPTSRSIFCNMDYRTVTLFDSTYPREWSS